MSSASRRPRSTTTSKRKEDILFALHLRLHALGNDALARLAKLSGEGAGFEPFVGVLDEFIDQVLANRKLFLFHMRNEKALQELVRTDHNHDEHEDMQETDAADAQQRGVAATSASSHGLLHRCSDGRVDGIG